MSSLCVFKHIEKDDEASALHLLCTDLCLRVTQLHGAHHASRTPAFFQNLELSHTSGDCSPAMQGDRPVPASLAVATATPSPILFAICLFSPFLPANVPQPSEQTFLGKLCNCHHLIINWDILAADFLKIYFCIMGGEVWMGQLGCAQRSGAQACTTG